MDPRDEDELWKEIVDNYGDAPSVEEHEASSSSTSDPTDDPVDKPDDRPTGESVTEYAIPSPEPDPLQAIWADEGRFVPPTPPPVPMPEPSRLLAWIGLFGAPLLTLVALVTGRPFHGIWSVLLALSFVGGFIYLVNTMPGGPRDPGDDGARL